MSQQKDVQVAAKTNEPVPEEKTFATTTTKSQQKVTRGNNVFATTGKSFATTDDGLFSDSNFGDEDFYAGVDKSKWRVVTRTYTKKDGCKMLYYNYLERKSYVNNEGKRKVEYKPGGKRVIGYG